MIGVKKKYSIEQFVNCESLVGVSISPDDEKVLVGSDRSGVYNTYAVSRMVASFCTEVIKAVMK